MRMCCECRFIEHGSQADQLEEAGLSAANVIATVRSLVERPNVPSSTSFDNGH